MKYLLQFPKKYHSRAFVTMTSQDSMAYDSVKLIIWIAIKKRTRFKSTEKMNGELSPKKNTSVARLAA